ncbi:Kelch repeats protein [Croceitalea dokdonensis DOKDO 023]|uniref:Kelch repeats protein n=1 Tax=Croceitalea dokdonensis DOKDO 023 TaxID=1300341 RepID=A0A0P7AXA3_9FLAO|nr:fibronectin type III domain-containing protein [Croceitalea dokdonensis]KPM32787.1 Kelch repeats protein [Croceitalea dokdonensis DOKDO 023]
MKTSLKISSVALSMFLLINCSKDEADTTKNEAPEAFTVSTTITDNTATITWTSANDPEGGKVSYSVLMEGQTVASNIEATTYTFTDLAYSTSFTGKIVAYDEEGLSSESPYSFETEMRPNTAPSAVVLAAPSANEESVSLTPELNWTVATDAENDAIVYEIFLDESSSPTTIIDNELTINSYTINSPLKNNTTYYWKVVARDVFNASSESSVQSFTTRDLVAAIQVTDDAGFTARGGHNSLVFDNKMWVIGGNSCCGGQFNDVWSSTDGVTWTQVTANANFAARTGHASVVFDGKMWVIGGNGSQEFNDIWNSSDGSNWTQVTDHIDINNRFNHKMLVFDNKMWIIGGRDIADSYSRNQVWNSTDGTNWQKVTDDAGFNMNGSEFTVFQNKIWRVGSFNDTRIYSTIDGEVWTLQTDNAPYGQRHNHSITVWDDKIWLLSGSDNATNELVELDDVWFSEDGVNWQLAAKNAGYTASAFHTSVTYANKIWKIAGSGGFQSFEVWNDVWTFEY